jgi:2-polyprenyl-6-methoxyphenol hydroxylase-like FAD-dependent oxidoreductase
MPAPSVDLPANTDVLIVGAGPAGLMLANWLVKLGVSTLVVDHKAGPTRESRAVIVQARSLEIYDQLGLGEVVDQAGRRVDGLSVWSATEQLGQFTFGAVGAGRTPHPYAFMLEQSENERLLHENLRALGGEVRWNTALESLSQDADGVTATLRLPDGASAQVRAGYLAGADGAGSTVRQALDVPFEGSTNPHLFYVADTVAEGGLASGQVTVKLGARLFLIGFPMSGDKRFRLIGIVPSARLSSDRPTFEDVRPVVEQDFQVRVSEVAWFSSYAVSHLVAARFRQGRVFLLGDAGHVHSPLGGQGMNTGLSDAHNLAWKLAAVQRGDASDTLLDSYQVERRAFARSLVRTTDRLFAAVTKDNLITRQIREHVLPALARRVLHAPAEDAQAAREPNVAAAEDGGEPLGPENPPALARLAFGVVSQTRIHYGESPLSKGRAGSVSGGDRLPWVRFESGDNYQALRSARPALHVYGDAAAEPRAWAKRHPDIEAHAFPYTEQARLAGLRRDAVYLVRPDGYVSLAMPEFDGAALSHLLAEGWGWRVG